jgi:drug/metabolite transporter (DMT)-like permease
MRANDNAIAIRTETPQPPAGIVRPGLGLGLLGVLGFSFSLPATKLGVAGLDPLSLTVLRVAGAGLLAGVYLLICRADLPTRGQLRDLALSSLGIVIGFPLFTSFAMLTSNTGKSAVILGLLPAVTAIFAALVAGEHLPRLFWIASLGGVTILVGYLSITSYLETGTVMPSLGDLWMLAATVSAAYGYGMGGRQAKTIGGPLSISWALVIWLPLSVPAAIVALLVADQQWTPSVAFGLGYVVLISQFLGFFVWYAGLARGGIARIGQTQQVQPLLTLIWAAILLNEMLDPWIIVVGIAVTALVAIAQRARFAAPAHQTDEAPTHPADQAPTHPADEANPQRTDAPVTWIP